MSHLIVGAATMIALGLMLPFGLASTGDLGSVTSTATVDDDRWWYPVCVVPVITGIVAQFNATARPRGSLHASWTESGGRQLRTL